MRRALTRWATATDVSRVHQALSHHPRVAQSIVSHDEGFLHIAILRSAQMIPGPNKIALNPAELSTESVLAYLRADTTVSDIATPQHIREIFFVDAQDLPSKVSERIALNNLMALAFKDADSNGDMRITLEEFKDFLQRYRIQLDPAYAGQVFEEKTAGSVLDKSTLGFEDFKTLLMETKLMFQADSHRLGSDGYGLHGNLLRLFCKIFFQKHDHNSDGRISKMEVCRLVQNYNLGGTAVAKAAFKAYDKDGDGTIDEDEFLHLLQGLDIVQSGKKTASA
jgi:Ca2+-binding EF-hand superfamily protein